jgi:hypothetical protein
VVVATEGNERLTDLFEDVHCLSGKLYLDVCSSEVERQEILYQERLLLVIGPSSESQVGAARNKKCLEIVRWYSTNWFAHHG